MTDQCSLCRHNRSGIVDIIVDGRTADQWEDWACEMEDEFTDEDEPIGVNCRFFERCTPEEIAE